jgi:hypothetical protein
MFERLYVEALLVDEDLADQVWELWNAGVITDEMAEWAWGILVASGPEQGGSDVSSTYL